MRSDNNFSIKKTTRGRYPNLSFVEIKEKILGKHYVLSLVFIDDVLSKKLNKKYRNKTKPSNILSFPLDKNEGEIFINLNQIRKDTKRFKKNYKQLLTFIFIHGLLHLKGLRHSSTMKKEEEKWIKRFSP